MSEPLLAEGDLWIGEMRGVVARGEPLLVVRHETGVCVFRDRCPHQGFPLSEGSLDAGVITCRAHRHSFAAVSGDGINPRGACLTPLLARVEGGIVMVDLDERRAAP